MCGPAEEIEGQRSSVTEKLQRTQDAHRLLLVSLQLQRNEQSPAQRTLIRRISSRYTTSTGVTFTHGALAGRLRRSHCQQKSRQSTGWRVFSDGAADNRCGLQTQAEVGDVFAPGLHLGFVAQRVSRGLAGLLKRSFSRDRLRLTVVELALRVDVPPGSRLVVL